MSKAFTLRLYLLPSNVLPRVGSAWYHFPFASCCETVCCPPEVPTWFSLVEIDHDGAGHLVFIIGETVARL